MVSSVDLLGLYANIWGSRVFWESSLDVFQHQSLQALHNNECCYEVHGESIAVVGELVEIIVVLCDVLFPFPHGSELSWVQVVEMSLNLSSCCRLEQDSDVSDHPWLIAGKDTDLFSGGYSVHRTVSIQI